jgi:uncharacterized protein (TIGR02145 family)
MKKLIMRVVGFVITVAVLFIGCEDAASPNNQELVDGFLVRVNEKPGSSGGGSGSENKYKVTVSSIGSGKYGDGNYAEGATVVIDAGTAPPNPHKFEKWTTESQDVGFANNTRANTAFTMPAHAVTVTAVFWDYGKFTDTRDSKQYKTTTIGGKTWMAENLNYLPPSGNSWCYDNDNSKCNQYGRLYDWNTARTVCPAGWHLPTRNEWNNLVTAVGSSAGTKLKSTSGWKDNGNGTDEFGFSALSGGYRDTDDGRFYSVGSGGGWWTTATVYAFFLGIGGDAKTGDNGYYDLSVRCVANNSDNIYTVNMTSGTMDLDGVTTSGEPARPGSSGTGTNYKEGDIVEIYAGTAPAGKVFYRWTATVDVTFEDATNPRTTFIMPADNVIVGAWWVDPF